MIGHLADHQVFTQAEGSWRAGPMAIITSGDQRLRDGQT